MHNLLVHIESFPLLYFCVLNQQGKWCAEEIVKVSFRVLMAAHIVTDIKHVHWTYRESEYNVMLHVHLLCVSSVFVMSILFKLGLSEPINGQVFQWKAWQIQRVFGCLTLWFKVIETLMTLMLKLTERVFVKLSRMFFAVKNVWCLMLWMYWMLASGWTDGFFLKFVWHL